MMLNPTQYFDPKKGMARQGDLLIWRLPSGFSVRQDGERLAHRDGRIILLEGEATGHHHSIGFRLPMPTLFRDDAIARAVAPKDVPFEVGTASLFRDDSLLASLVTERYLTTTSLNIGFLVVEGGNVVVSHQEHGGICVPTGEYYVGRQREFVADGERNVAD